MTALLTDNLSLLAGAPSGVKKLRELILELAVRGKLAPQDPSDEPAVELLNRIAEEKGRLVAEGKIKKGKAIDDVIAELSYQIPSTWAVASLGQVVEIVRGITFPASEKSKEPAPGRVACLRTANVQSEVEWNDLLYIRENFISRSDQYVQPHDIVMSMANSRELVGKVALIGAQLDQPTTFGGFLGVIRPVLIDPRFVMTLLRTPSARSALIDSASQTTNIANVSLAKLRPLPFAIPPLTEQHRIVTKVDELMLLCDRLEARQADAESAHIKLVQALLDSLNQASDAADFAIRWRRLAKNFHSLFTTEVSIDALKQTLLQLAVIGKLVPQEVSDEPAEKLYERIQAEKRRLVMEGVLKKQKPIAKIADEDIQLTLPSTWKWVPLLEITTGMDSGWSPACLGNSSPSDDTWGVLKTTAVQMMSYLEHENKELPSHLEPRPEAETKAGDILFTRAGPMNRVGISCLVETTRPKLMISDKIIRFHPVELGAYGRFIALCLNAGETAKYLEQAKSGMAASQVNISQEKLRMAPIPLAPLAEQYRIVVKIDQLMTLCNQLKTSLIQARQLNEQLANTLVERALVDDGQPTPVTTDQEAARTLLAAEITQQLHGQRTFGQRKLQKVIYLAEHAAKLAAIQGRYLRNVAGPHDRHLMNQIEGELQKRQWYERIERETVGHAYRPLSQAGQHRQAYESIWSNTERHTIERVIEMMRSWDTDRCEMTVTLYAAWNDFILEGRLATDEAIVDEVMHRWNDAKLRFSKIEWLAVLTDMKNHEILIPTGFGKRTTGGMLSLPGFE
ncbi:restriction endonuclease subunit S [Pseudomonas kilonensis]